MALKDRLDIIYTKQLRNHPEGHALYNKTSADHLRPGTCGFFDVKGDWKVIAHISDTENLRTEGWTAPRDDLKIESDFGIEWPLKLSESARGYEVGVEANANTLIPVSGGITIAFKSNEGAGAVLITNPPVERKRLQRDLPALDWVLQNTPNLLKRWPEILNRGIWVVTKTYIVKRCANAVLTSKDKEARISIQAKVANTVEAAPTTAWWRHGSDDTWNIYSDNSGVVVFMSGIQCKVGLLRKSQLFPEERPHKQKIWRNGSARAIYVPIEYDEVDPDDPQIAEILPEICGDVSSEVANLIEGLHEAEEEAEEDSDDEQFVQC